MPSWRPLGGLGKIWEDVEHVWGDGAEEEAGEGEEEVEAGRGRGGREGGGGVWAEVDKEADRGSWRTKEDSEQQSEEEGE